MEVGAVCSQKPRNPRVSRSSPQRCRSPVARVAKISLTPCVLAPRLPTRQGVPPGSRSSLLPSSERTVLVTTGTSRASSRTATPMTALLPMCAAATTPAPAQGGNRAGALATSRLVGRAFAPHLRTCHKVKLYLMSSCFTDIKLRTKQESCQKLLTFIANCAIIESINISSASELLAQKAS